MRVICIDDVDEWIGEGIRPKPSILKYGEIYNVIDEVMESYGLAYELSEDIGFLYEAASFIPISEIDETTFERNYKKNSMKQTHETKNKLFETEIPKVDICIGYDEVIVKDRIIEEGHGYHVIISDEIKVSINYIELQIAGIGVYVPLKQLTEKQKEVIINSLT